MSWSTADIDALDDAIKSNTLKVQFADRSVTYKSTDEMIKARNFGLTQIAATGTPIRRQLRMWTKKGF